MKKTSEEDVGNKAPELARMPEERAPALARGKKVSADIVQCSETMPFELFSIPASLLPSLLSLSQQPQ